MLIQISLSFPNLCLKYINISDTHTEREGEKIREREPLREKISDTFDQIYILNFHLDMTNGTHFLAPVPLKQS